MPANPSPASASASLETEPQAHCIVCGSQGTMKYRDLTDRVYGVPGYWSLRECQRGDCGTLWLDPRPTLASIPKAYANYYTHADHQPSLLSLYLRLVHFLALGRAVRHYGYPSTLVPSSLTVLGSIVAALYPGMRAQLDHFIRHLPFSSMGRGQLLDVGCGAFEVGPLLRDLGWHVHGVEVDPLAVQLARGQGLDVRQGTLAEAGFPEGSFDAVTSSHVIEHVHDPLAFLEASRRFLRTGGTLVAVTPNAHAWGHDRHGGNWLPLDPPRHLTLFTAKSLERLAQAAGLREVRILLSARATAFDEMASILIRRGQPFLLGTWPGLTTWIAAQITQLRADRAVRLGRRQGEELVLLAKG